MNEVWRSVVGFDGRYEVSNLGRVRSVPREIINSRRQRRWISGGVLVPFTRDDGYVMVTISPYGGMYVHRLVAHAFIGEKSPGKEVCHSDGDKQNNSASNLRYDTREGNVKDRLEHGPYNSGTKNGRAILGPKEIFEIRKLAGTELQSNTASRFGVDPSCISRIQNGHSWKSEIEV